MEHDNKNSHLKYAGSQGPSVQHLHSPTWGRNHWLSPNGVMSKIIPKWSMNWLLDGAYAYEANYVRIRMWIYHPLSLLLDLPSLLVKEMG